MVRFSFFHLAAAANERKRCLIFLNAVFYQMVRSQKRIVTAKLMKKNAWVILSVETEFCCLFLTKLMFSKLNN